MRQALDDPVLTAERHHLDHAHAALVLMRHEAEQISDPGADAFSSESLGALRARRLAALAEDPTAPPFFGRIDTTAEIVHIGRRHVRDEHREPLVVDWRAPVARAFYRATAADPMGVLRRRRFGFSHAELTSYEDELLDRPEGDGGDSDILRQEIERPRVGPMRDIVATIQPDQDEIVRSDLDQSVAVQGAPGTGKTAVGLHRAAYLLYTHPAQLRRSGVLVVGPNRAFLGYIAAVLPALGEAGVTQVTVDELVGRVPVRGVDRPDTARLKGDARMAAVLRRAVYAGVRRPEESVLVSIGSRRYRVPPERLRRYVDDLRRGDLRYSAARERLGALIAADVRRQREEDGGAPTDRDTERVARSAPVRDTVDTLWPAVDPKALLGGLFTDAGALAAAARDLLDADEQALLLWSSPPRSPGRIRWTAADAVLLDEISGLLDREPGFRHVVLDEAQDLSAMQCRAVGRRATTGSMTVLGDLAQGTTPWAASDWPSLLAHLGKPETPVEGLTRGYRVPGPVLELAGRLLPLIAPGLTPATSLRTGQDPLHIRRVDGPVTATVASVTTGLLDTEGSVGIIAAGRAVPALAAALDAAGVPHAVVDSGSGIPDDRVSLVGADLVKGMEFDHVVLVEPAEIAAADRGLQQLYVALTRAVSRLVVLHRDPLPGPLDA